MDIINAPEQQGWEPVPRRSWVAIQDRRPEFRAAFTTHRVGKIVDTRFYVTLLPLADVVQASMRELGLEPISIKSTNVSRDAAYWGFDTKSVSTQTLAAFATRLAASINDRL